MEFNEYQLLARQTATYNDNYKIIYPCLGLCGESGEVAEKIKKIIRDKNNEMTDADREEIKKELGDVLWYIANLALDLNLNLEDIAVGNITKLLDRKSRNKLHGYGDNR